MLWVCIHVDIAICEYCDLFVDTVLIVTNAALIFDQLFI